jgi:hypothetical protein
MRAGKPLFQRKTERTFVGIELPSFSCVLRMMVTAELLRMPYFLRTTTQPIE